MAKRLSKTPSFQVYAGDELRQSWWLASDTATSLYWRLAIRSHDSDQRGTIPFPASDSDYVVLSKQVSMTVEAIREGLEELVTLGAVSVTKGRKTIVIPTVKNDEEKKLDNRVKNQKTYHKSNSENKNLTKFIRDKSEINPPSSISSSSSLSSSNRTPPNPPPGGAREDEPPEVDPLEPHPATADHFQNLLMDIRAKHEHAKIPLAGTTEWFAWRKALADVIRLDSIPDTDLALMLEWLYHANHEDAKFWRLQIRAVPGLRTKLRDGSMTKGQAICGKWRKATRRTTQQEVMAHGFEV